MAEGGAGGAADLATADDADGDGGQEAAIAAVGSCVRRGRAGLTSPHHPRGSFLFLGPTGVGKTELCKALSAFLFDDPKAMTRMLPFLDCCNL